MKSLVTGFYLSSGGSVGRILHLVLCQMFFYAKILIEGGSCYAYNKEKEMADRVKKKEDTDVQEFLRSHGMSAGNDDYNYHMSLGFYYAYSADAFRYAEMIEDGEIFNEYAVSAVIKNLHVSYQALKYFQNKLNIGNYEFDTAETVTLEEARLENGRIIGNKDHAVKTARRWLARFKKRQAANTGKSSDGMKEKSISQDFFLYEVAVFILYLAGEEIDYGFIGKGG